MAHATTTWPRTWAPGRFPPIRPVWLILLGLVLLGVTAWAIYNGMFAQRQAAPTYQTAQVTRGNLVAAVSATGPVTSPTSLALTFKANGRLAELDVAVGDKVVAGQVLAKLDAADLQAQLAQAQAQLAQASARL